MSIYHIGETIICSVECKDSAGAYADPATSMKITIYNKLGTALVDNQSMTKDAVGKYHYDYLPGVNVQPTVCTVVYTATDGGRITKEKAQFELAVES